MIRNLTEAEGVFRKSYGAIPVSMNWNPTCDFDGDGYISGGDWLLLPNRWQEVQDLYPGQPVPALPPEPGRGFGKLWIAGIAFLLIFALSSKKKGKS